MTDSGPGRLSARGRVRMVRQESIAAYVQSHGVATPNELAEVTGASLMTVHRDLDELARRGVLRKFHGGVSATPSSVFESSSAYRLNVHSDDKEALARAALARISDGMSLMLDTSSTNVFLARLLARQDNMRLTIITNYLAVLNVLRQCRDIDVIMIGGRYSEIHDSFFGMNAVEMTTSLRANLAIMSTSAMLPDVTYHQDQDVVTMKRAMMDAADERLLLMDPTKIGHSALHRLAPTSDFDELVITDPQDPEFVRAVGEHVTISVIEVEESAGRGVS